jgi:hypothetical protein
MIALKQLLLLRDALVTFGLCCCMRQGDLLVEGALQAVGAVRASPVDLDAMASVVSRNVIAASAEVFVTADLSLLGVDAKEESCGSDDDGLGQHFEGGVGCKRLRGKELMVV